MTTQLETLHVAALETITGGNGQQADATRNRPISIWDSTDKVRNDTNTMRTAISNLDPQRARAIIVRDYGVNALKR